MIRVQFTREGKRVRADGVVSGGLSLTAVFLSFALLSTNGRELVMMAVKLLVNAFR